MGIYLIACCLAGLTPLVHIDRHVAKAHADFPGWPTHFNGKQLKKLSLSSRERNFETGFPGRIARFTDGERVLIVRWVTERTRKLHPAADCFKGIGYTIRTLPIRVDDREMLWGTFEAKNDEDAVLVKERLHDSGGKSWTDVSSWYWASLLGETTGPWWAVTVVERRTEPKPDQRSVR